MTDEKLEPTTEQLLANVARTRAQVAADVARLATQLAPAQLKDRAKDAAQHSLESLAARALLGLIRSPGRLWGYAHRHPRAGVAVLTGAAVIAWGLASRRRRRI